MTTFAAYDKEGRIHWIVGGVVATGTEGLDLIPCSESTLDSTHYVAFSATGAKVVEKSPYPTEHVIDGLSVSIARLPNGTRIEVQGEELVSDEEGAEIEFDAPGTYEIRIYPPPQYSDEVVEVTVG